MRSVLFFGAGVVLSLSFGTAFAQEPITTPLLSSDENFRDIAGTSTLYGGTGLANTTSYNGVMRTGVFYRSQDLSGLSDADSTVITSLKVQLDMDLRTPQEYTSTTGTVSQFDKVPKGATWTNVNIYGTYAPAPVDNVTTMEQAYQYMRGINEAFVDDSLQRKQIYTALMELANSSGPVLYHCSAGKDRTGWVSMLLEHIAGVSDATIMQDYLASNLYMNEYIRLQLTYLQQHNQVYMAPILVVDQSYLQAGLNQIIASYGSIDAYLIQGLGLTQADIYVLRAKMVYYPTLPGQDGFAGNAAAGAGLLSSLQNSPLSGNYTAFNYYLQSAIEAGTLGGVESQVGGQIHADAVSYLLREPLWLDWAIAPYTIGSDLGVGQSRCWAAGLGDCLRVGPRAGVAGSCDQNAGTVVGATRRLAEPAVAFVGVGYDGARSKAPALGPMSIRSRPRWADATAFPVLKPVLMWRDVRTWVGPNTDALAPSAKAWASPKATPTARSTAAGSILATSFTWPR